MRATYRTTRMLEEAIKCEADNVVIIGTTAQHGHGLLVMLGEMLGDVALFWENCDTLLSGKKRYHAKGRHSALTGYRHVFVDHKAWEDELAELRFRWKQSSIPVNDIDPKILPGRTDFPYMKASIKGCPYDAHAADCDCEGMGGDR